jgi:hypothetical protein
MNLRAATTDDLPVLVGLAVAFYEEDGFVTSAICSGITRRMVSPMTAGGC